MGSYRARLCSAPKAVALRVMDPQHHIGAQGGRLSRPKMHGNDFTASSRRDRSEKVPSCTVERIEWLRRMCCTSMSLASSLTPPNMRVSPASVPKALCSLAADPALTGRATSHQWRNKTYQTQHGSLPSPIPPQSKENKLTAYSGTAEKYSHSRHKHWVLPVKWTVHDRQHSLSETEMDIRCVTGAWACPPGFRDGLKFSVLREGQK